MNGEFPIERCLIIPFKEAGTASGHALRLQDAADKVATSLGLYEGERSTLRCRVLACHRA